jgi:hypothetical protein
MDPSDAISSLRAAGLTETEIGERVGARQSTINRIRTRKMQPNYELGKALVDLADHVARPRAANDEEDPPSHCPKAA